MIYLVFGLVIILCYVTLWQPEQAFKPGWRRGLLVAVIVGYAALAALAATGEKPFFAPLFVAFPLFYSVVFRDRLRQLVSGLRRSVIGRGIVVFILLWFSEIFAALDITSYDPLGRHMLVYLGFYIGLTLVIVFCLARWRFSFPALFTIGGLWGILVERQFAGSTLLLSGNLIGFLTFASVIFPVYGFYLAAPYLLFYEEWSSGPRATRRQYLLLFIAVALIPLITWALWVALLRPFGIDTTVFVV